VRGGTDGGVRRLQAAGPGSDQVRLVRRPGDRVDRVVDRTTDHRETAPRHLCWLLTGDIPDRHLRIRIPHHNRVDRSTRSGLSRPRRRRDSDWHHEREHRGDRHPASAAARPILTCHD
jgi:hypothetical protein